MKKKKIILLLLIVVCLIILIIIFKNNHRPSFESNKFGSYNEGIISAANDKNYSYIDEKGKVIFSKKYDTNIDDFLENLSFKDGIAPYIENELYGVIDKKGNIIIKAKYPKLKIFSKNIILVQKNGEEYFINYKDKEIISKKYSEILYPDEAKETISEKSKFIVINNESKFGVIDLKGNIILDTKYSNLSKQYNQHNNSYIFLEDSDNKLQLFDNKGQEININNISNFGWYDNNKIYYKSNDGNNYIYNLDTKVVQNFGSNYQYISPKNDGLFLTINLDNKLGYIDNNNKIVIDFIYKYENGSYDFENGAAIVNKEDKMGVIDKKGNTLVDFKYDEIKKGNNNNYIANIDNNFFIINKKGKILTDNYTYIDNANYNNYYIVSQKIDNKEKYGVLNENLKLIAKCKYLEIIPTKNGLILKSTKNNYQILK